MPTFLNEPYFWSGIFVVVASLGAVLIKEWFDREKLIRIERLKIYEGQIFAANNTLYEFVARVLATHNPDHAGESFRGWMKRESYNSVKCHKLLFPKEIRTILSDFEAQNECYNDPDAFPPIPFDEFIDNHLYKKLKELESLIEKRMDLTLKPVR